MYKTTLTRTRIKTIIFAQIALEQIFSIRLSLLFGWFLHKQFHFDNREAHTAQKPNTKRYDFELHVRAHAAKTLMRARARSHNFALDKLFMQINPLPIAAEAASAAEAAYSRNLYISRIDIRT